jgi:hypothetical protein
LLSIPERDRTDPQWDEIVELEIQLAPGNRINPNQPDRGTPYQGGRNNNNPGGGQPKRPGGGGGKPLRRKSRGNNKPPSGGGV